MLRTTLEEGNANSLTGVGGLGIAAALVTVGLLGAPWYEATFTSASPGAPLGVTSASAWTTLGGEDVALAILVGASGVSLYAAVALGASAYAGVSALLAMLAGALVVYRIADPPDSGADNLEVEIMAAPWLALAAILVLILASAYTWRRIE